MRLKLDENLPHDLAAALARRSHDVHTVADEHLTGESDPVVVVAAATDEGRMCCSLSIVGSAIFDATRRAAMPESSFDDRFLKIQTAS